MATTDIRLKRIEKEYQSVRDGQDDILDRIDTYEAALLGLTESVSANHDLIMANRELIMANHDLYQRQFAEVNEKLGPAHEAPGRAAQAAGRLRQAISPQATSPHNPFGRSISAVRCSGDSAVCETIIDNFIDNPKYFLSHMTPFSNTE